MLCPQGSEATNSIAARTDCVAACDSFCPCNSWAGCTRASKTDCSSFRFGAESDSVTSCDSFLWATHCRRKAEGGSGGKRGHSNMVHLEYTEEVKQRAASAPESLKQ